MLLVSGSRLVLMPLGIYGIFVSLIVMFLADLIYSYHTWKVGGTKSYVKLITAIFVSVMIFTTITFSFFHFRTKLLGIDIYYIPSVSMTPTLSPGDYIVCDTWFDTELLVVGDIVVFEHPEIREMFMIKRISDIVSQNKIRVLGDNLNKSLDSRIIGNINKSYVKGKAVITLRDHWPQALIQ